MREEKKTYNFGRTGKLVLYLQRFYSPKCIYSLVNILYLRDHIVCV